VVSIDGRQLVEGALTEPAADQAEAEALGRTLAAMLVTDGAGRILEELRTGSRSTGA
jgi:hypothetical protein